MKTRISAFTVLASLLLGLGLALLTLTLLHGVISGSPPEGWKVWLLLGLAFFTAEQLSALALPALPRLRRRPPRRRLALRLRLP